MKKLFLVLGFVLVLSVFVGAIRDNLDYTDGGSIDTEIDSVTVNVEKGWNLLHGFGNPDWIESGDISSENIKAVYAWNSQLQEYVRFYPSPEREKMGGSNTRWDTYISASSFWVYSDVRGEMTYKTLEFIPLEYVSLFSGWNFIGFTTNIFYDDTFSWDKIKGNCNYEKIYAWNPEDGEWMSIAPDLEHFDLNDFLGMGMIVKVSGDCKLEKPSEVGPPSLPVSDDGCVDSDGGLNYYTKGTVTGQNEDAPVEGITSASDTCSGDTLFEFICKESGEYDDEAYMCPNGCEDGACLDSNIPNFAMINAPFYLEAWGVRADDNTGTIDLGLKNNAEDDLILSEATVDTDGGIICVADSTPVAIVSEATIDIPFTCDAGLTLGDSFKGDISIKYTREGDTTQLASTGSISTTVIEAFI